MNNIDSVQQISQIDNFNNEESKIDPEQVQEEGDFSSEKHISERDDKQKVDIDDWNLEDVTVSQQLEDLL